MLLCQFYIALEVGTLLACIQKKTEQGDVSAKVGLLGQATGSETGSSPLCSLLEQSPSTSLDDEYDD